MEDWTIQATGWVEERNFEIDTSPSANGYVFRARVTGFPMMQDHEVFNSVEEAKRGAVAFLEKQFETKARLST